MIRTQVLFINIHYWMVSLEEITKKTQTINQSSTTHNKVYTVVVTLPNPKLSENFVRFMIAVNLI